MVILTVLTFAFVSAEAVFLTATNHEIQNFQDSYEEVSQQLIRATRNRLNTMLLTTKNLVTNIGYEYKNEDWPFVFISNFNARSEVPLELTNASMISFLPKVQSDQLVEWQEYATNNFKLENPLWNVYDTSYVQYFASNRGVEEGVYRFENQTSQSITSNDFDDIFPIWQMSPLPNATNYYSELYKNLTGIMFAENSNILRSNAIQQVMNRTGSVMTQFLFQDTNYTDMAYYEAPRTNIYYPIKSNISEIIGIINMQFRWETVFQQVIGEQLSQQIVIVVSNSCGGNFSYEVNGPHAAYLGQGEF
jgi:hypothetical protein